MIKRIIYLLSIALLMSCSDFLEEYSQDKDYVRSWKDLDELLIGDCYLPVTTYNEQSFVESTGSFISLLGDEMDESQISSFLLNGDGREKTFGYFTWQQRVGQNESYTDYYTENETWTTIYKKINIANNILASVETVPCKSDEERQGVSKVKGEAHFLRAYYYFWLANVYAKPYNPATSATDLCVPIKTSSVVEDTKFSRQTVEEVYQLVLSDLAEAEKNLCAYKKEKKSIYRADSTACHLLQSRVYLYMQNWAKASEYAKKVMKEHPGLMNLNTESGKFSVKNNVENIFSMGGNTIYGMFCNSAHAFTVSSILYNSYSANDMRKKLWYWHRDTFTGLVKLPEGAMQSTISSSSYYYYDRYIWNKEQQEVSDIFLFRSAEAYLNYAEAQAYMGNESEAIDAINTLRANRISSDTNPNINVNGGNLITAIRRERMMELALEGHRWFDLRRYSVCSVQPESKQIVHEWTYYSDHSSSKAVERHRFILKEYDDAYTLPLPREVIQFNTGMEDNIRPWREYTTVEL